jgi:uncharacterized protein YbgA (DUF1722 family)/uncharacterized protein YbbK (DUF523 family)
MTEMPKVGVSSCLVGEHVRYDGGHKHNRYITETLGACVRLVPLCPEVGIGLSTPRPPVRLVQAGERIRAVGVDDETMDVTDRLTSWAQQQLPGLSDLSGYIVKKNSPSCGMERVRVYVDGVPETRGRGVYTGTLMAAMPSLPVEEEGRLMDAGLRENFIDRVFARFRWLQAFSRGVTPRSLVDFHTRHKFFILAHDEIVYRRLGRLVADVSGQDLQALAEQYLNLMMEGLKHRATPARHTNVLMHIMGFFKDRLDRGDKGELLSLIDEYRNGQVPLVVPITLINHYLRKFPQPYVQEQVYLHPHPAELMLRNHV